MSRANFIQPIEKRFSKRDMQTIATPWLASGARLAGVKSLYDVPEYFRQKLELQGAKVGGKSLRSGFADAGVDVLSQRSEKTNGNSTGVRDALGVLNKKLALTKEGSTKGSQARGEVARILNENRNKKNLNRQNVHAQFQDTLDNYTTQKVDGFTATREGLRTALTVTGTRAFMPAVNAATDALSALEKMRQTARRNGEEFNSSFIKKDIQQKIKAGLAQLKTLGDKNVPLSAKISVLSNLKDLAGNLGIDTGTATDLAFLGSNQLTRRGMPGTITPLKKNLRSDALSSSVTSSQLHSKSKSLKTDANRVRFAKKMLRGKGLIDIKKRVKATRVNMTVLSVATPIWFTIQLPLALAAIFALGMAGVGEGIADQLLGTSFGSFLYSIYDGITNVIEYLTSINLNVFESWSGFSQVLFGGLTMFVFLIGMITLFAMAVMYVLSGVRCFMGEHAAFKMVTFIFAMLGYLMPILNIFPWFMLWGIVVWRYPK